MTESNPNDLVEIVAAMRVANFQQLHDENNDLKQQVLKRDREIARLKKLKSYDKAEELFNVRVKELSNKSVLLEAELEKSEKRVRDITQENLRLQRKIAELQSIGRN